MLNSCQAGVDAAKLSDEKKISVMKDVNAMVLELEGLLNRKNSTERFVRRGGGGLRVVLEFSFKLFPLLYPLSFQSSK